MSGKYTGITVEKKKNIGYVFFDDPENNNRTGYAETVSLTQALKDCDADKEIKAVILSGKGNAFCTGGKVDGFPDGPLLTQKRFAQAGVDVLRAFFDLSKPIIAAVNAQALAGGLMFIEVCDLAVAGRSVMFGLPEIKRGYFPMLAMAVLQKSLPKKRLFELAFTNKQVNAETMLEWNLINEITDDDKVLKRAEEIAETIASFSSVPISLGRDAYYKMIDLNLSSSIEYSGCALLNILWTDDVRETAHAQEEGREPIYKGQ
ncbi:MAG: enoyl-CoA hydratase/isomerase family protein [Oscillospiraceae bacterium]|nr:enoyl-CoA hydratase/isomerase family protein [Oscillospiraceae bacterium]